MLCFYMRCHGNSNPSPSPSPTRGHPKCDCYDPQSTLDGNRIKKRSHLAPNVGLLTSRSVARIMKKGGIHLKGAADPSWCFALWFPQSGELLLVAAAPDARCTGCTAISWSQQTPSTSPDFDDNGAGGICRTVLGGISPSSTVPMRGLFLGRLPCDGAPLSRSIWGCGGFCHGEMSGMLSTPGGGCLDEKENQSLEKTVLYSYYILEIGDPLVYASVLIIHNFLSFLSVPMGITRWAKLAQGCLSISATVSGFDDNCSAISPRRVSIWQTTMFDIARGAIIQV